MDRPRRPFVVAAGLTVVGWLIVQLARRQRIKQRSGYFDGKVIVITGASRGIGRELALALARRGAYLVLASRNEQALKLVARECMSANRLIRTLVVQTDVTDDEQLGNLVEKTLQEFGRIDILINNAGIRQGGALTQVDLDTTRNVIQVNLLASMHLTQLVLPAMLKRDKGVIVNLASAAGHVAEPYF
nr:SDR family NAD(P)-dependent oxidoreductase [Anaerolineae bacterium]